MSTVLNQTNTSENACSTSDEDSFFFNEKIGIILTIFIQGFLFITIFSGNFLVAAVVLCTPHLKTFTNMFILSVTTADLFSGIHVGMFIVVILNPNFNTVLVCKSKYGPMILWWMASVHSLLAVTLDRYIAIMMPLHYSRIVTKPRVFTVLCFIWIYSLFVALFSTIYKLPLHNLEKLGSKNNMCDVMKDIPKLVLVYCICNFAIIFAIIAYCYWRIYFVAKLQSCRVVPGMTAQKPRNWKKFLQEKKYAWSLFMIMLLLVFTWGPMLILLLVEIGLCKHNVKLKRARIVASFVSQSSSVFNPLIFTWRNVEFRKTLNNIEFRKALNKALNKLLAKKGTNSSITSMSDSRSSKG